MSYRCDNITNICNLTFINIAWFFDSLLNDLNEIRKELVAVAEDGEDDVVALLDQSSDLSKSLLSVSLVNFSALRFRSAYVVMR